MLAQVLASPWLIPTLGVIGVLVAIRLGRMLIAAAVAGVALAWLLGHTSQLAGLLDLLR